MRPRQLGRVSALIFATSLATSLTTTNAAQLTARIASTALANDAAMYAKDTGVTSEEAERRLLLQPKLEALNLTAAELDPSRYAGGWIEHDPEYRLVIAFTGSPATLDLAAVLGDPEAPVVVRDFASHSYDELLAAQAILGKALAADFPDMGSSIDVRTGSVVVIGPTAINDNDRAQLTAVAGVPVTVQYSPKVELHHTYGGHALHLQANNALECTSTFSVRNVGTSVTGVLTAGHCPDALYYVQDPQVHYNITLAGQRWDADQDWQWHTTPHDEFPQFWSGIDQRDVWGGAARLDMPGDFVCHFGMTTGRSCGTIQTIHYQDPNPSNCNQQVCAAVWVTVQGPSLACFFGDSGGPWYQGNIAYGIHHAGSSTGPGDGQCSLAVFNSIGAITSPGNDLELMTAP